MATKTDAVVMALFEKVRTKQREISKTKVSRYLTNCSLGFDDNISNRTNIQTVSDQSKIIELFANLLAKQKFLNEAAEVLSLPKINKWQGYSFEDWFYDLRTRSEQISITAKRKELKELEEKLDTLVTVEQRRELELAEIAKKLDE